MGVCRSCVTFWILIQQKQKYNIWKEHTKVSNNWNFEVNFMNRAKVMGDRSWLLVGKMSRKTCKLPIGLPLCNSPICYPLYDNWPNWTPLSPITIIHLFQKSLLRSQQQASGEDLSECWFVLANYSNQTNFLWNEVWYANKHLKMLGLILNRCFEQQNVNQFRILFILIIRYSLIP